MNAPHCCGRSSAQELWVLRVGRNGGSGEEKAATAGETELKDQEERRIFKKREEVEGQRWRNVM